MYDEFDKSDNEELKAEHEEREAEHKELKAERIKTEQRRIVRLSHEGGRNMSRRGPKNVTIRGIDADTYDDFSQNMKILGMTMGEAISKMMKDVLADFDGTFPAISAKTFRKAARLPKLSIVDHDHISIQAQDLAESESRIVFHDIKFLEFEPNVTRELFLRHVSHISDCKLVRLPAILPKLLVLSKIRDCSEIEIYESEVDKSEE